MRKNKTRRLSLIIASALTMSTANVALAATGGTNEIYAGLGTTGLTVGYGYGLSPSAGIRVDANYLDYSRTVHTSSVDYKGDLKLGTVGAYYDIFLVGPFRLSSGVLIGSNKFEGAAMANNGYITINHQPYSAKGQQVKGKVKFKSFSPYLGVGWGHRPNQGGLGFFGDLGIAYGRPDVTLAVSEGLRQAAGKANIAAEQATLQKKADKLNFFPVLRIGLDYQW